MFLGSLMTNLKAVFRNSENNKYRIQFGRRLFLFSNQVWGKRPIKRFWGRLSWVCSQFLKILKIQKCGSNMVDDYLYFLTKIGLWVSYYGVWGRSSGFSSQFLKILKIKNTASNLADDFFYFQTKIGLWVSYYGFKGRSSGFSSQFLKILDIQNIGFNMAYDYIYFITMIGL